MKIVLYQIVPKNENARLMYLCLSKMQETAGNTFPSEIYEPVYSGEVDAKDAEEVFCIFNTDPPKEFRGRSMSVSDVLEIVDSSNQSHFFFCDTIGFSEISFDKEKVVVQEAHNQV